MIDLHLHSSASDGSLTPAELVRLAVKNDMEAIAITDHDTVEGVDEALEEGRRLGIEVIPGVEISSEYDPGTMHITGLFININDHQLRSTLDFLQKVRRDRNLKILNKLGRYGIKLEYTELERLADNGQIGRPHFARLMVVKGYCTDIQEAFDRYLKKGGPAYIHKKRLTPEEAVKLISGAGGIPILAHPVTLGLKPQELDSFVNDLVGKGLKGIEVYYCDHTQEDENLYKRLARKYNLLITGGTDFHGSVKEGISMGVGRGNMHIPYEILLTIKKNFKLIIV